MNRRDASDLADAIGRFIDCEDQSALHVGEIEGIVIECCQDQDWFDLVTTSPVNFWGPPGGKFIRKSAQFRPMADFGSGCAGGLAG